MVFAFLENAINLGVFTQTPVPQSNSRQNFCFAYSRKGRRKPWFTLSKFNKKIWRWLETLSYLHFVWFVFFLNVMTLQFCKSYRVILSLLPLLCNHDNLTLKFHPKNSNLNEVWLFIGRFKVGSLPRMINKEVKCHPKLYIELSNQLKIVYREKMEIYYSCYVYWGKRVGER